jgi:hypothetical protein
MIRRILRYPQNAARNLALRAAVKQRIHKTPGCLSMPETDAWLRVEQAKTAALKYLNVQRHNKDKVFEYRYSAPTLYASAYACMILSLLGELPKLAETDRLAWISYFDTFQSAEDGLYYDIAVENEIFANTDWWGARHLALHMISAYTALGGAPKHPFRFLEPYYQIDHLSAWLDAFDWTSSIGHTNDIDNKIMNIGCLLQYQRDTWNDPQAAKAVSYLQDYLKSIGNSIIVRHVG